MRMHLIVALHTCDNGWVFELWFVSIRTHMICISNAASSNRQAHHPAFAATKVNLVMLAKGRLPASIDRALKNVQSGRRRGEIHARACEHRGARLRAGQDVSQ